MTTDAVFLRDGPVAIRPWRASDARPSFHAIQESSPEVSRWLADMGHVVSVSQVEAYIAATADEWANGSGYNFAIVDAQDTAVFGGCGLTQINRRHHFANLFYWVRTVSTRQGVASRAIGLAARFGCEALDLQRIEVVVDVDNIASLRAAAKAGAVREAVLRNRLNAYGEARDAFMFSFIPSDFASQP